jgi:hypothetical protein
LNRNFARAPLTSLPRSCLVQYLFYDILLSLMHKRTDMIESPHMKPDSFKQIFERVSKWPKDAQNELVRSAAEIEKRYREIYGVNHEERAALDRSGADVRRGRFAIEHEIDTVFGRFHRE